MTKFTVRILTIFPELFPGTLTTSILNRALQKKIWQMSVINIRDFAKDKHRHVDDYIIGGGNGMLLKADVLSDAIDHTINDWKNQPYSLIYMSPRGKLFNHSMAKTLSQSERVLILCGRFEGIDQRVIDYYDIAEISIGDYVLSGGELAAQVLIDACLRLIPDVLGSLSSSEEDSFSIGEHNSNILEYPQYTKPTTWRNIPVPEILLSGHHEKIKKWRHAEAISATKKNRNDLYENFIKHSK